MKKFLFAVLAIFTILSLGLMTSFNMGINDVNPAGEVEYSVVLEPDANTAEIAGAVERVIKKSGR